MFYPQPQENHIYAYVWIKYPVIAGYAANDRIIHTFQPTQNNPFIEPDKAPIILRFPRQVIDPGKCVYVDFNNQIARYITDPPAIPYQFPTLHNQSITLPVYPHAPEYAIIDHGLLIHYNTFDVYVNKARPSRRNQRLGRVVALLHLFHVAFGDLKKCVIVEPFAA